MLEKAVSNGDTVYHSIYGKGEVVYEDAPWYYGVKFAHGEECIHETNLYTVAVDENGKPIEEKQNLENDNNEFVPHDHLCEIKMIKGDYWRRHCPHKGKLSYTEIECDNCKHLVIVEFEDNEMTTIKAIKRKHL